MVEARLSTPGTACGIVAANLDFQLRALGLSAGSWCRHEDGPRKYTRINESGFNIVYVLRTVSSLERRN
jgi:hypothetical protein